MLGKVALGLKAKKAQELWKELAPCLTYYEEVQPQENGTAIYILQARFPTEKDARMFMAFQQLSAELEQELSK